MGLNLHLVFVEEVRNKALEVGNNKATELDGAHGGVYFALAPTLLRS